MLLLVGNAGLLSTEVGSWTFSFAEHAVVSALSVTLLLGALFLFARLEVHPAVASLLVPVGFLVAYFVAERATPPIIPTLALAVPAVFVHARLLPWIGGPPSARGAAALVGGSALAAIAITVADRAHRATSAQQMAEAQAAYLREHAARDAGAP